MMSAVVNKKEAEPKSSDEAARAGEEEEGYIYQNYVRKTIEQGLMDAKAGRTKDVSEVRAKFGLPK